MAGSSHDPPLADTTSLAVEAEAALEPGMAGSGSVAQRERGTDSSPPGALLCAASPPKAVSAAAASADYRRAESRVVREREAAFSALAEAEELRVALGTLGEVDANVLREQLFPVVKPPPRPTDEPRWAFLPPWQLLPSWQEATRQLLEQLRSRLGRDARAGASG